MPDLADIYPVNAAERRFLSKLKPTETKKEVKEDDDEGKSGKGTKAARKSRAK